MSDKEFTKAIKKLMDELIDTIESECETERERILIGVIRSMQETRQAYRWQLDIVFWFHIAGGVFAFITGFVAIYKWW